MNGFHLLLTISPIYSSRFEDDIGQADEVSLMILNYSRYLKQDPIHNDYLNFMPNSVPGYEDYYTFISSMTIYVCEFTIFIFYYKHLHRYMEIILKFKKKVFTIFTIWIFFK